MAVNNLQQSVIDFAKDQAGIYAAGIVQRGASDLGSAAYNAAASSISSGTSRVRSRINDYFAGQKTSVSRSTSYSPFPYSAHLKLAHQWRNLRGQTYNDPYRHFAYPTSNNPYGHRSQQYSTPNQYDTTGNLVSRLPTASSSSVCQHPNALELVCSPHPLALPHPLPPLFLGVGAIV